MNEDKKKFKFVNDEESFLVKDEQPTEKPKKAEIPVDIAKAIEKKKIRKRNLILTLIMFVVTVILVGFGLLWQDEYTLMAFGDALWLTFAIEFAIGWSLFVYNLNIFSPIVFATQTLFRMFVGKRPKSDYYTYMKSIEENPVPKYVYVFVFISAMIVLIPAIIIMIILL